jgi:cardiolipin synthase C
MKFVIKPFKFIILILSLYILYAFIFGALYLKYDQPTNSDYKNNLSVERFYKDSEGPDRIVLLEDGLLAYQARIELIEQADHQIDITYYKVHEDEHSHYFLAKLLEAADRGVHIRLIMDGVSNYNQLVKSSLYLFTIHPNIEVKYYEPLNLIKPWSLNNRLHDKIILIDHKQAILGGRNMGSRYYTDDASIHHPTKDRDVLVFNTKDNLFESVIPQINDYFKLLWDHPYTKVPLSCLQISKKEIKQAELFKNDLLDLLKQDKFQFESPLNFIELSYPTNQIHLIHNPIERMNKEPWVLMDIESLMQQAKESVFIQSPYIIPTDDMIDALLEISQEIPTTILTNAVSINPNFFGSIGYSNDRKKLHQSNMMVYEYQGPASLHGKSLIIDGRISVIGSFNMDARSTHLSTETMLVIDSEVFTQAFEQELETLMNNSLKVTSKGDYELNSRLEPTEMSKSKKMKIKILAPIIHFFDYLL